MFHESVNFLLLLLIILKTGIDTFWKKYIANAFTFLLDRKILAKLEFFYQLTSR